MREILFRGMTIREKWVYGNLIKIDKGYLIHHSLDFATKVIPNAKYAFALFEDEISAVAKNTIGQYTGLKDKNGKMIFEGDIVKAACGFSGVVNYDDFIYYKVERAIDDNIEIIGNIHDNPELAIPNKALQILNLA